MSEDQLYDELDSESLNNVGPTIVEVQDDDTSDYYFDDIFDDTSYNESTSNIEQVFEVEQLNLGNSEFDIYDELFA